MNKCRFAFALQCIYFPCIFPGHMDKAVKSQRPPSHTHALRIYWRCLFCCPNSRVFNPNPKWIWPPMGFIHVFSRDTWIRQSQKVRGLPTIPMHYESIDDVLSMHVNSGTIFFSNLCKKKVFLSLRRPLGMWGYVLFGRYGVLCLF